MPIKLNKGICAILVLSLFIFPVQASAVSINDFSDISSQDWYVADGSLPYALEHGIVNGYDGKFAPQDSLTLEQFTAVLTRVFLNKYPFMGEEYRNDYNAQYDSTHPFAYGGWADVELYIADRLEISKGLGDIGDKAVWTAPITRFQMAQLVANTLLGPLGETAPDTSTVSASFTDRESIEASPYKEGVEVAVAKGILQGNDGAFSGDRVLIRSELCAVVYRLMEPGERIKRHPVSTITEGKGSDTGLLPKEGDIYITADGTQVTLTKDNEVGVLGWNAIPGHKMDIYTGCRDSLGDVIKHGSTVFAEDSTTGGGLIEGPQGWWTAREWQHIMNVSEPTYSGKADGETAVDGIWTWDSGEWCWTGPR